MTDLPAYTLDELMQRARDHIRSRVRGADVGYGSDYDLWARLLGTVAFMFQKQIDTPYKLLDPRKAFGTFLREFAGTMAVGNSIQETSYAARRATGKVIILSTTASQTQLAASVLTHADGTRYTLDANATTSAAAAKTLRAGHRAGKRRVFQGHVGGGFVNAVVGEVYQFSPTSEYCAVYGADNNAYSDQFIFDLYNDLDQTPAMHDQFVQKFGAVGSITAVNGGAAGNKDPKDVLTISSPAGTILGTAYVLSTSGGRDALTPAQMQDAIRKLHGVRQGVMALEEIRQVALAYPGTKLREVFILPGQYGLGGYTLVPVADGAPFVNQADRDALELYVESYLSPADKAFSYPQTAVEDTVTEMNLKVVETYAPDWTATAGLAIQAASTTTRVNLNAGDVTTAVARGLEVNDRVIISITAPFRGYIVQRRVTAIGAAYVDVDQVLPYPPGTTGFVTPGGPIGQDVIDAIYDYYDNQSPALSAAGNSYYRYPSPESTDNAQGLFQHASDVEGVIDASGVLGSAPVLGIGGVLTPGPIQILMWT